MNNLESERIPVITLWQQARYGLMRQAERAIAAIEATRTQTDQPKLERLEAKWLKWPDGDAGDAIDFACDHCAPDEALAFMNDWREGMAGEWPGYVSWLKTQRDGARANLNAEEPSE